MTNSPKLVVHADLQILESKIMIQRSKNMIAAGIKRFNHDLARAYVQRVRQRANGDVLTGAHNLKRYAELVAELAEVRGEPVPDRILEAMKAADPMTAAEQAQADHEAALDQSWADYCAAHPELDTPESIN